MTLRLPWPNSRITVEQSSSAGKTAAQFRPSKSKWRQIKGGIMAGRDHTRRAGAMATMSTVRTKGMQIIDFGI